MIVMDLEWNYAVVSQEMLVPGGTLRFEIIQIGAVMVDAKGNITKTFDSLIEPQVHPAIKRKVSELTGLTEKKLKGQPKFPQVWRELSDWMGQDRDIMFWGNCDRSVLLSNLLYYGIPGGESLVLYDLQALFDMMFLSQKKERQQTALSTALSELNIIPYGQYHSAFADAVNASYILKKLGGEAFVNENQPKLLEIMEKKAQSSEPKGELILEKRFRNVTDPSCMKNSIEPELAGFLHDPVTEVLPGFYRNHKKIWAYRTNKSIIKVTSRSKFSQSGKGRDYVIRIFKIDNSDLDRLCIWSRKAETIVKRKHPHTVKQAPKQNNVQEDFLAQRNRKRGQ